MNPACICDGFDVSCDVAGKDCVLAQISNSVSFDDTDFTTNKLRDEESLRRNFDPKPVPDDEYEPTSYAICFNSKCEDYKVRRDAAKPCQCARSKQPVRGAGSSPGWY